MVASNAALLLTASESLPLPKAVKRTLHCDRELAETQTMENPVDFDVKEHTGSSIACASLNFQFFGGVDGSTSGYAALKMGPILASLRFEVSPLRAAARPDLCGGRPQKFGERPS